MIARARFPPPLQADRPDRRASAFWHTACCSCRRTCTEEGGVKEKILIVDDDEGVRQVLSQSLSETGYRITSAESGEKAVSAVREETFDIVILDMVLPRVDGMEVLKEITALRPEMPVVMITGYASVETAIKAMKMGAVGYIVKPFRMEEVDLVVGKALERSHLRRE